MKRLLFLLPMFLIACGGSNESSSSAASDDLRQQCVEGNGEVNGVYFDVSLNKFILYGTCLGVTEDTCNHTFTYYKPVNGKMLINVTGKTSNSSECLPEGEIICDVDHRDINGPGEELHINCGKGTVIYLKDGTF